MASVDEIFAPIYGKQCWSAEAVYGSFLSLEFGDKHLWERDARVAAPPGSGQLDSNKDSVIYSLRGAFHLSLYHCEWRVVSGDVLIGDSISERGIRRATSRLDGYRLKRVTVNGDGSTIFQFDRYHRLVTKPRDKDTAQWFLYATPGFQVLTCYGDGRLDHRQNENCYEDEDVRIIAAREADSTLTARGMIFERG